MTPPPPSRPAMWSHVEASPPVQPKPPRQKRPYGTIILLLLLIAGLVAGGFAWKRHAAKAAADATDAGAGPDADMLLGAGFDDDAGDEADDVDLDDVDADVLDAAVDAPAEAARPTFTPPKKKPPTRKPPRRRRW